MTTRKKTADGTPVEVFGDRLGGVGVHGAMTPAPGENASTAERLRVTKAYKMYVGGAFVRSESGRYFQVKTATPEVDPDVQTINVPRGSRKDVRDAVLAAKNAEGAWAARTPFNRGQIFYRLAEVMEGRRDELVTSLVRGGAQPEEARLEVDVAIDRAIFYAGFCDKVPALVASSNPVSGPHFGFSVPEPMGIVAVIPPARPALLGLVSTVLPVAAGGNTVVALASPEDPRTAVVFCECLATSDLPGGVINVLTGDAKEVGGALAKHREVIGLDSWSDDPELLASLEREGADNVKRVKGHGPMTIDAWVDDRVGQGLGWIERYLETKSIWHPVGL